MPTLVQIPSGSVERIGAVQALVVEPRVHGDRVRAGLARRRPLDRIRAEPLGQRQPLRVGVDEVHPLGAEGHGYLGGVQRDAVRAAADDQHGRARLLGQLRPHAAPRVRHVVGQARHGRGLDAIREREEHRAGEGHAHEVGQRAAPVAADGGRTPYIEPLGTSLQLAVRPARQRSHSPHDTWKVAITRSPAATPAPRPPRPPRRRTRARGRRGPRTARCRACTHASRSHIATASGRSERLAGPLERRGRELPATPPGRAR